MLLRAGASVLLLSTFLASPAESLSCGAGKWYDETSSTPKCYDCAEPEFCPEDRTRDSDCAEGYTVSHKKG